MAHEPNIPLLPTCFIGCETPLAESRIVLFGAPFDGTVTFRPGSRFGPAQMRPDSYGLEAYSPYQDADLEDAAVHDAGDLDLPFGRVERALAEIGAFSKRVVEAGRQPLMLGGEHLVTLPALKAVHAKHPDLCVLHFDAHTDLRADYLGEPLSHATVLRRVWDELGDGRIFQFGIRSGLREEFEWAKTHTHLHPFDLDGLDTALDAIGSRPVYVTIDLDVLDPSVFPGTGTPEPGGVTFRELLAALCKLRRLRIAGGDVVELAPHYDASGVSTAVACKVVRELAVAMSARESQQEKPGRF
ncbi:agmatinase [Ethanoligenens harbinense]|uniref:Agmatinase n=1 Tax=Ethanoligenens harbinense (strain DSM 18485 / JCM 12961 / CGMCC 1.5033 / YUAN-3) TaxID=663278 RepID=E6U8R1_ETHHY|nr:agmatinase [Ethanoligenens harbinense]ADU27146.1 agmatinase [Ethanoligenens harbinense YUAN-3]AVQ96219.1 agmatinase [Ethanoligenens harbinense YUAN-3]AYF38879.1 agmatinase [Ethanoligenens harbinense]AYF41629.1 agmatinase [Ethanoligenens harbinense]QCN92460.1 agmatinase [Ethanoligenens harbinense]